MSDGDVGRPLDDWTLDVYASREGDWWNPGHGDIAIPDAWDLLPSGDAYVTRTVKHVGPHWFAWQGPAGPDKAGP